MYLPLHNTHFFAPRNGFKSGGNFSGELKPKKANFASRKWGFVLCVGASVCGYLRTSCMQAFRVFGVSVLSAVLWSFPLPQNLPKPRDCHSLKCHRGNSTSNEWQLISPWWKCEHQAGLAMDVSFLNLCKVKLKQGCIATSWNTHTHTHTGKSCLLVTSLFFAKENENDKARGGRTSSPSPLGLRESVQAARRIEPKKPFDSSSYVGFLFCVLIQIILRGLLFTSPLQIKTGQLPTWPICETQNTNKRKRQTSTVVDDSHLKIESERTRLSDLYPDTELVDFEAPNCFSLTRNFKAQTCFVILAPIKVEQTQVFDQLLSSTVGTKLFDVRQTKKINQISTQLSVANSICCKYKGVGHIFQLANSVSRQKQSRLYIGWQSPWCSAVEKWHMGLLPRV